MDAKSRGAIPNLADAYRQAQIADQKLETVLYEAGLPLVGCHGFYGA